MGRVEKGGTPPHPQSSVMHGCPPHITPPPTHTHTHTHQLFLVLTNTHQLPPPQVSEFQSNLRCAAQHLFWSSLFGSVFGEDGRYDAFETLMQVWRGGGCG